MKLIQEDTTFQGLVYFLVLPFVASDTFKNTATPNVFGRAVFKASGSVVTITNFLNGSDGQTIRIIGDGTTTIQNNTNIITNPAGTDIVLNSNVVYRFTYLKSTETWYGDD